MELENGTYAMTVKDVREDKIENPQFGDGTVVRIDIELDDMVMPDGEPVELDAMANAKLSPKSKLGLWIAALGFEIKVGQEFDLDDLKGAQGLVVVENEHKDDVDWPRIVNIVAAPKSGAAVSLSKPDGKPDFTVFWTKVKELGKSKTDVDALGVAVPTLSVAQLEAVLARLGGNKKPHEHDWQYTPDGKEMICRDCGERQAG